MFIVLRETRNLDRCSVTEMFHVYFCFPPVLHEMVAASPP
jgi:hypothetical protein